MGVGLNLTSGSDFPKHARENERAKPWRADRLYGTGKVPGATPSILICPQCTEKWAPLVNRCLMNRGFVEQNKITLLYCETIRMNPKTESRKCTMIRALQAINFAMHCSAAVKYNL